MRRATEADAEVPAELLAEPGALTIVAENENHEISGWCTVCGPSRDADASKHTCEVASIEVRPDRRRWGIGRALMRAALDRATGDGYEVVTAWVPEQDDASRAFLASFGFKPDDVVGRRDSRLRMRLTLA